MARSVLLFTIHRHTHTHTHTHTHVTHTHTHTHTGSDIFINGKKVDDFNVLDKKYIYTLNVSATQERHKIIMEQKNKINDLEARLARLEAIINLKPAVIWKNMFSRD